MRKRDYTEQTIDELTSEINATRSKHWRNELKKQNDASAQPTPSEIKYYRNTMKKLYYASLYVQLRLHLHAH